MLRVGAAVMRAIVGTGGIWMTVNVSSVDGNGISCGSWLFQLPIFPTASSWYVNKRSLGGANMRWQLSVQRQRQPVALLEIGRPLTGIRSCVRLLWAPRVHIE